MKRSGRRMRLPWRWLPTNGLPWCRTDPETPTWWWGSLRGTATTQHTQRRSLKNDPIRGEVTRSHVEPPGEGANCDPLPISQSRLPKLAKENRRKGKSWGWGACFRPTNRRYFCHQSICTASSSQARLRRGFSPSQSPRTSLPSGNMLRTASTTNPFLVPQLGLKLSYALTLVVRAKLKVNSNESLNFYTSDQRFRESPVKL